MSTSSNTISLWLQAPPSGRQRSPAPMRHAEAGSGRSDTEPAFAQALALLEAGQWQPAFDALGVLADAGHPQAARLALLMVHRGPVMFGGHYAARPERRRRWLGATD